MLQLEATCLNGMPLDRMLEMDPSTGAAWQGMQGMHIDVGDGRRNPNPPAPVGAKGVSFRRH